MHKLIRLHINYKGVLLSRAGIMCGSSIGFYNVIIYRATRVMIAPQGPKLLM